MMLIGNVFITAVGEGGDLDSGFPWVTQLSLTPPSTHGLLAGHEEAVGSQSPGPRTSENHNLGWGWGWGREGPRARRAPDSIKATALWSRVPGPFSAKLLFELFPSTSGGETSLPQGCPFIRTPGAGCKPCGTVSDSRHAHPISSTQHQPFPRPEPSQGV